MATEQVRTCARACIEIGEFKRQQGRERAHTVYWVDLIAGPRGAVTVVEEYSVPVVAVGATVVV
jgi:hypothetical protein